ncbi:MAG: NAD(P)H-quinone oxidoreductase [Polyangiales bacterium]
MKAIVIRSAGGPEVLELRDVVDPAIRFGHVRVAVDHAGVNRADMLQRLGVYPAPDGVPADIPGLEYAGTIAEVGEGVRAWKIGDRVFGVVAGGAYAEQIVLHAREVTRVPDSVDLASAAAIPEAFLTAWDALTVRGRVQPGDRVLIHAVGSGVGTAAIQLCKAIGCATIGTSRTEGKLARCKALGLDVALHTKEPVFADAVRAATGGAGVDVVIDLVGGSYFAETLRACASKARVVCVGLTAGRAAEIDLGMVLGKRLEIIGTVMRARPLEEKIAAAALLARPIATWLGEGKLKAIVDRIFPLADAADAHRLVASDSTFGKVLLSMRASAT